MIETSSEDDFKYEMRDVDIPIDSNVVLLIGNRTEKLTLFDAYRPHPSNEIR